MKSFLVILVFLLAGFWSACISQPTNNNCSGATTLTQGTSCIATSGTTVCATQSITAISCASYSRNADDDVWHKFVANSTNPTIQVVGSSTLDPVVDPSSGTTGQQGLYEKEVIINTSASYTLSGTAKSTLNTYDRIPGAVVMVDGNPALSATTADDGTYQINNVPSGTHTVAIAHDGYTFTTSSYSINFTSNKTQDFTGSCKAVPQITYTIPSTFTPGVAFNITVNIKNTATAILNVPLYLDVSFPNFTSTTGAVTLVSQTGFDGPPTFYQAGSNICQLNMATAVWNCSYPANYLLTSSVRTGTIYFNQQWTLVLQIIPPSLPQFKINLKGSIGDRRDPSSGTIGQQGLYEKEIIMTPVTSHNITMDLHMISSSSGGVINTINPGIPKTSFIPGETVRVTFKAQNTGGSVPVQCVCNILGPDGSIVYDSYPLGQNNSTDSPLEPGEGYDYYSFDWVVPSNAANGSYSIGASIRDGASFNVIYETTCTGANSGFNCDWIINNSFTINTVNQYLPNFLDLWVWLANQDNINGNLAELYSQNKKKYFYISGSVDVGVGVKGTIYIDLADYYSGCSYNTSPQTIEGQAGWITCYIDLSLSIVSASVLPIGMGITPPKDFSPPICDTKRSLFSISALNGTIPFMELQAASWELGGFSTSSFSSNPTINIEASLLEFGTNLWRFEIQKSDLDQIINSTITAGFLNGTLSGLYSISDRTHILMNSLTSFQNWMVFQGATNTRQFTYSDNNINPTYDGYLSHLRGGLDINYDGIPDNKFHVYPSFVGFLYGDETKVTFVNKGNEPADFKVKVTDVPSGWNIKAMDGNYWPPIDHTFDIDAVVPNTNSNPITETTWSIGASETAVNPAIVTFSLYRKVNAFNWDKLDEKKDTLYKLGNIFTPSTPPTISILQPNNNISLSNGEVLSIQWNDEDPDNNAIISVNLDPDLTTDPWQGNANHYCISQGQTIYEDPDGQSDFYNWNVSGIPDGTYTIWVSIFDFYIPNGAIFTRAAGFVTIGQYNPSVVYNGLQGWRKTNSIFDIDFAAHSNLVQVKYQINSNDDSNPLNWHNLTTNGQAEITTYSGTTFSDNWMINDADWNSLSLTTQNQGWHYLYFKVTDAAGNVYITPSQSEAFKFGKDIYPPNVSITYPEQNQIISQTSITAQWYVDDFVVGLLLSGVQNIYYALDQTTNYTQVSPNINSTQFTNLSQGSHTLYVYAIDNAGNQHDVVQRNFTVNTNVNPPNPFSLINPNNTTSTNLLPLFQWQATTDPDGTPITYELWYAYNSSFSNKTVVAGLTATSYQPSNTLSDNSVCYWKVKAVDGAGQTRWCSQLNWSFYLNAQNEAPLAFNLNEPGNNITLTTYTPYFDWSESTDNDPGDAVNYQLQIGTDASFANGTYAIYSATVSEYPLTLPLTSNTNYYWRVKAVDNQGAFSWSTPVSRSFTTPNHVPTLSWTGQPGYESDGVNPETGVVSTLIDFRITYTDMDNDAPASSYPKVHISKSGIAINGSPFSMTAIDAGSYSTGRKYGYSTSTLTIGTDYSYYFEARDGHNGIAIGNGANPQVGPSINGLTLINPNGGESWNAQQTYIISWTFTGGFNSFDLFYSTNNGSSWNPLALGLTGNLTSYTWPVPNEPSSTCKIKVTGNYQGGSVSDESNSSFSIISLNNPPNSFSLLSPHNDEVTTMTPTFTWNATTDPENTSVHYELYYSTNPNYLNSTVISGLTSNQYTPSVLLQDNTTYYWKVKAIDGTGMSRWADQVDWFCIINTTNNAPNTFILQSPSSGSTSLTLAPVLTWSESVDVDPGDIITYEVQIGTNPAFTSGTFISYVNLTNTSFIIPTPLNANTNYYWKVIASDNHGAQTPSLETNWWFTTPYSSINLSASSLPSFGNIYVGSCSSPLSYTVSGTNLSDNIIITAPDGFQVSTNNTSGFGSSVSLPQIGGTITARLIYVIFCPTSAMSYSSTTLHASLGASTQSVFVSGLGLGVPTITVTPSSMPFFGNVPIGISTQPQSYSLTGSYLTSNITLTAPSCFTIAATNVGPWQSNLTLQPIGGTVSSTIFIKFSPTSSVSYTGSISHATTGCTNLNLGIAGEGIPSLSNTCPDLPFISFGGQFYNTIQIGDQCWLRENINNGTRINASLSPADNGSIEKNCYNDVESNCNTYGGLYNWNEMMEYSTSTGSKGICPTEWHVPTDAEWCTLAQYVDPTVNCTSYEYSGTDVGLKLKETGTTHWSAPNSGSTNSSGFTAMPGGLRSETNLFQNITDYGNYWTSSQYNTSNADYYQLFSAESRIKHNFIDKHSGLSIRCIKDACSSPMPVSINITASANPVCTGTTVTFIASPTNGGLLPGYQWKKGGIDIPGATNSTYSYIPLKNDVITCQMTSNLTCATGSPALSNAITMTVNPSAPVSISISPSSNPVCSGTSVTFTATPVNGGSSPGYQWKKNNVNISGATNSTYSYVPLNNDTITCRLTSNADCATGSPATSNAVTMVVNSALTAGISISASSNPACAGTVVTFTATPSNGGSSPGYQWKKGGVNIAGATNSTYSCIPLNNEVFTCQMTSNLTCATGNPANSNAITMSINQPVPVSVTIDASANGICQGTSVSFTATPVNGGSSPGYQWKKNSVNISGATNSTYIYAPANGDAITCELTSNATCISNTTATSNTINIAAMPPAPVSISITASANPVCSGTAVTFTAAFVNGGIFPGFQWKKNGTAISGATNSTYTYTPANNDIITCVLTSNVVCPVGNPATSNAINMSVTTSIPAGVSILASTNNVCAGTTVHFTAYPVNGGTSPGYQWKKNGVPVGTNQPTYSCVPQNFDVITCTLTSNLSCASGNPVTSNAVIMNITTPAVVGVLIYASSNPSCSGAPVTYTATASNQGTTPVYRWMKNGITVGSNSSAYSYIPSAGDLITCELTSNATCIQNPTAISNVITTALIPSVPVSVSIIASANPVCSGTPVTFTASSVNGGNTPVYQWKKNGTEIGPNSPVFTYAPGNGDVITCTLISSVNCPTGSPATSNAITMGVNTSLAAGISVVPSTNPACQGSTVTFTAAPVNGGTTPVYQWKVNGINVGVNTPAYSFVPQNNDQVWCEMTSNLGCATGNPALSNTVTMVMQQIYPVALSVSASANPVCVGSQVIFTAHPVNGGAAPAYQWKRNGIITGTNDPVLSLVPDNNDLITCQLTSSELCTTGNPAVSNQVIMTVNPNLQPGVTVTASENPVCNGTPVSFSATPVNGGSSPGYQWRVNNTLVGTNNPSYTYIPSDNDYIVCDLVSNASCITGNPATSNVIRMSVDNQLFVGVSITVASSTVCIGSPAYFTAHPVNGGLSPVYQWRINGINAVSAGPTFSYIPVQGDVVTCEMTSGISCAMNNPVFSNPIEMTTVQPVPVSVSITTPLSTVCQGRPITYTAYHINGGPAPSYQWKVNGINAGTNNQFFTYIPSNGDVVSCILTTSLTCVTNTTATSNVIQMTVDPLQPVSLAITPSANPVLPGTAVTFTATWTNGGSSPVFQWKVNGISVGSNSPVYTYVPNNLDEVVCEMTSDIICVTVNPVISNPVNMVVTFLPVGITISATANNICAGSYIEFTATPVNGGTDPQYQWKVNGIDVGTNSPAYGYTPVDQDVVTCVLTSNAPNVTGNPATSNPVIMIVKSNLPVSVIISPDVNPVCPQSQVTLTAVPVNGGTTPFYQWKVNGINSGVNNPVFTYFPSNGDIVVCRLTSSEECTDENPVMSNGITMQVPSVIPVSLTIGASANPVNSGIPVTFTANPVNPGNAPFFQWKVNGVDKQNNTPVFSYIPVNGDQVVCLMTSGHSCASVNPAVSNTIIMTVNIVPAITVLTPDGGEYWIQGSVQNITWTDNISENVKIELLKGETYYETLVSSTPSTGSWSWTIPADQQVGIDYRIRITSVSDNAITDNSDASFKIMANVVSNLVVQNMEISNGMNSCFDALNTITVAGNGSFFHVTGGSYVTFIAGVNILFMPGTQIYNGGMMHGYIAPTGPFCGTMAPSFINVTAGNEDPVEPMTNQRILIYPNPTTGIVTLEFVPEDIHSGARIYIYSMNGSEVLQKDLPQMKKETFMLDFLTPGIYLCRIVYNGKQELVKIVML